MPGNSLAPYPGAGVIDLDDGVILPQVPHHRPPTGGGGDEDVLDLR